MEVPFIEIDAEKKWYYSKDPMAQISGPRGSGKTYFIYYLLLSTAEIGADIYILDPKRSDLSSLRFCYPEEYRNNRVATTPAQICKILREVCELMNERYEQYFEVETSNLGEDYLTLGLQPIFVFFDEVLAMVEEDSKLGKEAEKYLKQIILKGRQSGIYAIISSQRLSADAMSTVIRENAGMRVVLGKVQPESYRMGLGESFKNLPSARKGVGQGYIYLEGQSWETPKAFTAPYLDMSKINFRQLFKNMIEKNLDL